MKIGESALIKDVKLLVISFSATVVSPFAPISIRVESVSWMDRFFQPIHVSSFLKSKIGSNIKAARNCRNPATNQGGTVSTPILMPRKVVPHTMATMNMQIMVLELNAENIKHKDIVKTQF